jgi:hypothetical protein
LLAVALLHLALTQTPPPSTVTAPAAPSGAELRAAQAAESAEKAAEAAQKAAEAAQKAAEALQKPAAPPPAPPAAPPAPPAPAPQTSSWNASVGLGAIALFGNTNSVTFTANAAAEHKTETWVYAFKASGSYGETTPPGVDAAGNALPSQTTALAAGAQIRADRRFTPLAAAYLLGQIDTDHIKSIEYRPAAEGGLSLFWFDTKLDDGTVRYLRTDVGAHYAFESRFQYYGPNGEALPLDLDNSTILGPRVGLELRYGLTKDLLFVETDDATVNVIDNTAAGTGAGRTLFNSLSKLSVNVMGNLAVGASLQFAYDSSMESIGKKNLDTTLALSLEYKL